MSTSKRKTLAVVAAVAAFAAVSASAASLGGLTSDNLGADATVVASCDKDGVSVSYTTQYDVTSKAYLVTKVQLDGIDVLCAGQTASLTLSDAGGASLGGGSAAVPAGGGSMTFTLATPASAQSAANVAVVIAG